MGKRKEIDVVKKRVSKKDQNNKASKFYVLSALFFSILLLFVYFIDYSSPNSLISNSIVFLLIAWFFVNIFTFFFFLIKKDGWKAITLSLTYILYMGIIFLDIFVLGFTKGSGVVGESISNTIELILIIFSLVLSLSAIHNKDYS